MPQSESSENSRKKSHIKSKKNIVSYAAHFPRPGTGVAAVLTGKTAVPSKGGLSENDDGLSGRSGSVERKYFAQQAVVVPRGRAVFKPVVNRIDSLEIQVMGRFEALTNQRSSCFAREGRDWSTP